MCCHCCEGAGWVLDARWTSWGECQRCSSWTPTSERHFHTLCKHRLTVGILPSSFLFTFKLAMVHPDRCPYVGCSESLTSVMLHYTYRPFHESCAFQLFSDTGGLPLTNFLDRHRQSNDILFSRQLELLVTNYPVVGKKKG